MPDGPNSIGVAPRSISQSSSNHVGAIVGGTIGGVALLALIAFATAFLCLRHRKQRRATSSYDDTVEADRSLPNGTVQPFDMQTPSSAQFVTVPGSMYGDPTSLSPTSATALVSHQAAILVRNPDSNFSENLDGAPPSYELSEGLRSSPVPRQLPSEKSQREPSLDLSYASPQNQQTDLSTTRAAAESSSQLGSGSNTVYDKL